ncbi:hypothetical protein TREMEDRAFT_58222 [Tremella mesenterica DSM 1558]|uniref:uncharacterized protein n=1 Tax=Tremella mesenterica (strain ATCC 24925 / CBS 8224 / DSM 1558 / NBRC 9311 / NRRL Y-6157 / RJB 2259-6 / UBC 559-6) TaxID=578456 RepID=UPI0003F497CB|nr:uncharacterized protein TREMEDRAFT_58222 [Tremella mesenterica DSM 1558]EIW72068.1 hypothetical protein TREMEDRAFT_58222 [Tremella mesenterica DSM 1558]
MSPITPSTAKMQNKSSNSPPISSPTTPTENAGPSVSRRAGKANVSSACGPCKRAHLACDVARPCKRCVNMGKEDQCEDVPHKKRGRPKVVKPSMGEPYQRRPPPPNEPTNSFPDPSQGKWRGPSSYDAPYMATVEPPPPLMPLPPPPPPPPPISIPISIPNSSLPRPISPIDQQIQQPNLFTLFTTTELKILRASQSCYPLTGYHPHEFVNLNLLDWLHPSDRHLIDLERQRLINVSFITGSLQSDRETQAAITQRSERELLSPAEGMRDPYPNQNARVLRSDNLFNYFNIRLHLGGGLGASLWRSETLSRVYIVVSLLLIPTQQNLQQQQQRDLHIPISSSQSQSQSQDYSRRISTNQSIQSNQFTNSQSQSQSQSQIPPTPITPIPHSNSNSNPTQGNMLHSSTIGLPGFSSIAAAADSPLPSSHTHSHSNPHMLPPQQRYDPSSYYSQPLPPTRGHPSGTINPHTGGINSHQGGINNNNPTINSNSHPTVNSHPGQNINHHPHPGPNIPHPNPHPNPIPHSSTLPPTSNGPPPSMGMTTINSNPYAYTQPRQPYPSTQRRSISPGPPHRSYQDYPVPPGGYYEVKEEEWRRQQSAGPTGDYKRSWEL